MKVFHKRCANIYVGFIYEHISLNLLTSTKWLITTIFIIFLIHETNFIVPLKRAKPVKYNYITTLTYDY